MSCARTRARSRAFRSSPAACSRKKLAEGAEGLVIDVKWGNGSFIKDLEQAKQLARSMTRVGRSMKRRCVALVTDMNQPLGDSVGTALEVKEAIQLLRGEGPEDMKELVLKLGMEIVRLAGVAGSTLSAKQTVQRHLDRRIGAREVQGAGEGAGRRHLVSSTTRRNSRRRGTSASCPRPSAATSTPSTRR